MRGSKLLLSAVLLLSLGACSSSTSENQTLEEVDNTELAEETGESNTESIEAESNQGDEYSGEVGSTLTFDGVSITLDDVSYQTSSELTEGYELVVCTVTVKNDSDVDLVLIPSAFSMENSQEITTGPVQYQPEAIDKVIEESTVEPGGELKGIMAFEELEGESPLTLTYLKDTANDEEQTLTWTITR